MHATSSIDWSKKQQEFTRLVAFLKSTMQGQPMHQLSHLQANFWLHMQAHLRNQLTTQALLYDVITTGEQQLFSLGHHVESLVAAKKEQARAIDEQLSNLDPRQVLCTSADMIGADGRPKMELIAQNKEQVRELAVTFDGITKGHLISASE